MKNLSRILFVLMLVVAFNCKKDVQYRAPEPEAKQAKAEQEKLIKVFYTGTTGVTVGQPIHGVRGTAIIPNFGGGAKDRSFWWALDYSNGLWGQHGAAKNERWGLVKVTHFYFGRTEIYPHSFVQDTPISEGQELTITQENLLGTDVWETKFNNVVVYRADLGIDNAYRMEFKTEVVNTRLTSFPKLDVTKVFEWKDSLGNWHPVPASSVGSSQWPMAGNEQDRTIPVNALRIGYKTDNILTGGITLWDNRNLKK
jgi:hypothetical protein